MTTESARLPHLSPPSAIRSNRSTIEASITRVVGAEVRTIPDTLAVEEPLEIQLAYGATDLRRVKSISATMRTPGHDFDLAAGFLCKVRKLGIVPGRGGITRRPQRLHHRVIQKRIMVDCMSLYFVAISLLNWPPLGHDCRYSTQLTISKRH